MCEPCGCGDTEIVSVKVHESILKSNNPIARHNREHFAELGMYAVNLMGSPGAGKTAILEATSRAFAGRRLLGALAGDLETERDADRLRAAEIGAAAITTGSACHLDAKMVHNSLHHFPLRQLDYLFIENVGNLVCPAIYDLGQSANVVALSVTEGEDKPLKYSVMFRNADLVLLTKTDLLPYLPGFRIEAVEDALARTMPDLAVIKVSSVTCEGVSEWLGWLEARRASALREAARSSSLSESLTSN